MVEDCIQIENIREDTRLRLIRESDEKSMNDETENIFEDTVTNGDVKENNEENPGHHGDADITGDATDS